MKESDSVTFGVNVSPPPHFKVSDVESKVFVNAKGDVIVKLVSDTDLEDASVIISAEPPLSVLSAESTLEV